MSLSKLYDVSSSLYVHKVSVWSMGLVCFNNFSLYLSIFSVCLFFSLASECFLFHFSNVKPVHIFAGDQVRYVGSAKKDDAKHR